MKHKSTIKKFKIQIQEQVQVQVQEQAQEQEQIQEQIQEQDQKTNSSSIFGTLIKEILKICEICVLKNSKSFKPIPHHPSPITFLHKLDT